MAGEQIRCLVTGATGYIGGRLVPRLLDGGFAVRALARNPDKLSAVPWRKDVEVARGDLNDRASLEAAFDEHSLTVRDFRIRGGSADRT